MMKVSLKKKQKTTTFRELTQVRENLGTLLSTQYPAKGKTVIHFLNLSLISACHNLSIYATREMLTKMKCSWITCDLISLNIPQFEDREPV